MIGLIVVAAKKRLFSFLIFCCLVSNSFAQPAVTQEEAIVQKFYLQSHQQLFWFSSEGNIKKATEWLLLIENAEHLGISSDKLQSNLIRVALLSNKSLDSIYIEQRDRQISGIVLNFIKVLQEGNIKFDYDGVNITRDSIYINLLRNSKPLESVSEMVERLDCKDYEYAVLKKFLNDSIRIMDSLKYKKIAVAMNYRRYFSVNHPSERIVVNIPEMEVIYYQNDFLKVKMRAVVGKKMTPTPTIASFVTDVVTFPRWNVPHSIAVTEILPKVQLNENYLEQNNYEVVDAKGHVIDESILKWKSYDEKNFPYFFRQGTGSRNALGIIKFDLANPFSIFLHATSWQGAFTKDYRFLSHGCVRLEKPFVLADRLLNGDINIKKLKSGRKNTESKTIKLPHKVPVFIVYNPVIVVGKKVIFLPDTYGLIN
ncbi:MAG: L,D-transpeptidase family protein [Prolixibacteraceae bacterium]|jgi:murein L,D-transpeptidase YcbB/YkuD|nr:L,D-transpeptidase family protein [Prolixibacteraceae bacterium]